MLYLYTVIEAIIAVVAGIFIALRTKKQSMLPTVNLTE